ncbi:hypothetical protein X975_01359, partial [Stegodyphus mimosarum]
MCDPVDHSVCRLSVHGSVNEAGQNKWKKSILYGPCNETEAIKCQDLWPVRRSHCLIPLWFSLHYNWYYLYISYSSLVFISHNFNP